MADWTYRASYIAKHGTTVAQVEEALSDDERLVLEPDPASRSGVSVRTIGFSASAAAVLTVITVLDGDRTYGVNCWPSNSTDQAKYRNRQEEL
ncbi:hypothetical protein [Corynebacterium nuruki]|uniref:hypothetical protein n=1 Tax=Corynebacterium nuruki TaxID=1032851 RepID=UPI0002485BF1|nr:hypothetical protein [Corynebacterium nuruki]